MGSKTAIATFKELCLDSHPAEGQDQTELGRFWAAATGCDYERGDERDPGDVVGVQEGMGIAICPVPEPRTVKHRVHLDIAAASVQTLVDLGATVLRGPTVEDAWTVLADPEGGELCAFVRPPEKLAPYRTVELTTDSVDADSIGAWWGEVFALELRSAEGKPWRWLEGVPGMPFDWVFDNVPEPKTVKNRWHWDLYGEVDDFLARGATLLWEMPRWTVLADPEGNEFCVFPAPDAEVAATT